ncbi:MAG: hypothetical protein K6E84_02325 [Lachnospiraceae bacterium]|nr:hypothetical protein [Lachnospiraceae bacterium]
MEKKVVLGMELNRRFLQISYAPEGGAPATLHMPASDELLMLPLCIGREKGSNRWYYGEDAAEQFSLHKENMACDLLDHQGEKVMLGSEQYTYGELLHLFMGHGIRMAMHDMEEIEKCAVSIMALTISVEPFPEDRLEELEAILANLPVPKGQIRVQRNEDSLFSYLSHQPEKLLGYVTGVFDLTDEKMVAYCMEMNPRTSPVVTSIERDDDTGIVKKKHYPSITEHDRALAELDLRLAEYVMHFTAGRIVTSIYLIGDGFSSNWYEQSRRLLCKNRKVYAGNNLFSKGAAFSASERIWPGMQTEDFLFLGKDMLRCNIGLSVVEDSAEGYLPLLDAGTSYYDAQCETQVLLEQADEIRLQIQPIFSGKSYEEVLKLDMDQERPGRSFSFLLQLSMSDAKTLKVVVKDEGFGRFYPPQLPKKEFTVTLKD